MIAAVRAEQRRCWLLAASAALFVLVAAGRIVLVSLYAESVPYWDQWDAEGANLIKPWLDGTLTLADMLAPHNEHRILFTRLVSLALLEANDEQWDNLAGAYANAFIYAAIPVLLFASFAPGLRKPIAKWMLFAALLSLSWLPYAHHNALVAFQNQFFFMSLFAIIGVWTAARAQDNAWILAKVIVPALLGIFTMASGLLGAVAAGGVLALRLLVLRNLHPLRGCISIAALAMIAIGGYLAVPHIVGHEPLKAHDAATWLRRFVSHLGWPLAEESWFAWIPLWLPSLIATYHLLRRRDGDAHELASLGLAAWALMQAAAIAYSRDVLGDRYFDTLAVGLLANFWLALRLLERGDPVTGGAPAFGRRMAHAIPLLLLSVAFTGLILSTPSSIRAAVRHSALATLQTTNVRQFVASGDRSFLDDKAPMHIPYPSSGRLATLLFDPTLRQALAASVRAPLPLAGHSGSGFEIIDANGSVRVTSCVGRPPCEQHTGTWRSQPMSSHFPYLQVPVIVNGATAGLSLSWSTEPSTGKIPPQALRRRWLLLRMPASSFSRLRAEDASPSSSLLFRAPVEVGRLGAIAMSVQDCIRSLFGVPPSEALRRELFFVESPTSGSGAGPLRLDPQKLVQIEWNAPRSGQLATVSTMIGNYLGRSDGLLALQACSPTACRSAQAWLRQSVDLHYFGVLFDRPLEVHMGQPLVFKLWTYRATNPVAILRYGAASHSPRVAHFADLPPAALANTTVRLRFGFLD